MFASIIISLKFQTVQTYLAKKTTNYLSKELKTNIEIKSIYLEPFRSLVLEGFIVEDLQGDTLLQTPKLKVDINFFSPFTKRKIIIDHAQIDDGRFFLKTYKDSSNLSFIMNYFSKGEVKTSTKKNSKQFDIDLKNIAINNLDFKYINFASTINFTSGVNYNNIHLKNFSVNLKDLDIKNHLMKAQINQLTFKEKSGFYLKNLTALTTIDTNSIVLENMLLETPQSKLKDYYSMRFKSFKDFSDYTNKVVMEGNFKESIISARDIAYFAAPLSKMNLVIEATGLVKGTVANLKSKGLTIKSGHTTYIKGDFNLRGLPIWENTFLDLKFDQIYSNKHDIDQILGKIIGMKIKELPAIIDKFGNINFSGQFTGFQNDFIAYGEFKTKLGRIKSDVNMRISKNNIPSYSGKIEAFDFNLGELINEPQINRTSFKVDIIGEGINQETLKENIIGKVEYLDFKNYRYTNIDIKGKINQQLFDGKLTINDKNIKLDFDGIANLNPQLPEFNFVAKITDANLRKLNFIKDSIVVDADFKTNFTGNSLDNIQGDLSLRSITLTSSTDTFSIDSVALKAQGIGKDRLLAINSDIGDAKIQGEYDLATLPSAFKTVVKKYIPSLQTKIVKPENQNFEFNIDLKNFDYVSSLFIPELKIPERGIFNGKFDSQNNLVTLNGFVKTIKYKEIIFSNLIIDQNTNSNAFEAIISLDEIGISDGGLTIQNIIIQNTLRRDSLSFNIKLADKNAINQLDLYGLIEFGSDTLAKVSLLPSDVIIDHDIWKIEDKVRLKFEEKRTIIEGFELSNKNQMIAINGAVSSSKDDLLEIVAENFKLSSLSQLTKGFGVDIEGTMNGNAHLSAILGTPNIESELTVDSLRYNKTQIGFLELSSAYDNEANNIIVNATIQKNNKKTADINGVIDFKSDTDNLNLNLLLDQTELIIFEPFVSLLVSDLKGNVSSNLKILGKFNKPEINGELKLSNAGVTVNYLKTPYLINDKVSIEGSIIRLNNLIIKDKFNNQATATGTVNLNNLENPEINVIINAVNFMALNTTAKDNPAYYGTAYGTGTFNFNGPTDAMRINIKAKTEEGTVFTIPLNGASILSNNDFITYVAKDSTEEEGNKRNFFKGLTMEFELNVDQASTANILTEVGNLSGKGDGQLRLRITSLGDFEMFGDYIIDEGHFDFTANNVINKTFEIKKGGTIRWTGNPSDANINLNAAYSTRATILPLYQAAGRTLPDERRNERIQAEAEMVLVGSLLNPNISFNLQFPNNTGIRTELQGYLDNKDNEEQQVINLVVRNGFNGNSGAGIGFTNVDLLGSGLELAFSKLNNIISQSLNIKNLDINVRSQNEIGGSYSFFNNRLRISGNFVNNKYTDETFNNSLLNTNLTDVTRDLEMSFNINQDGSFIAKAFQRPTNRDFFNLNTDIYINGFGLVYTQEYDSLQEFIKNTFAKNRKEERKNEKNKAKETKDVPVIREDEDEN